VRPKGSPISSRPLRAAIPRTAPGPKLCPNVASINAQHQKIIKKNQHLQVLRHCVCYAYHTSYSHGASRTDRSLATCSPAFTPAQGSNGIFACAACPSPRPLIRSIDPCTPASVCQHDHW